MTDFATTDAFDALAPDYDASFTASDVGRRLRGAVWRRLEARFAPGTHVLELGCGTGEDAVHLARRGVSVTAVDRSAGMVERARDKVARADLEDRVRMRRLAIEDLHEIDGPFDGALSNFGVLNCVEDLGAVAAALAAVVRPGGWAVLVVMGPLVPWEWLWFLARGQPRTALRRLRPGGVLWHGIRVRYPGPRTVRRTFEPAFVLGRASALGAFVPPSYAEAWAAKYPRRIERLDRWERRAETWPPLVRLADHYVLELERR